MGGARAPARFATGTLKISHRDDAAEVEARSELGADSGARVSADPNTIHRAGPEDAKEPKATPAERIAYFAAAAPKESFGADGKKDEASGETYHAFHHPTTKYRYQESSPEPFRVEHYKAILKNGPATAGGVKKPTGEITDNIGSQDIARLKAEGQKYRFAVVTDRTYAFIHDGAWVAKVDDGRPNLRKEADPVEQFEAYFAATKVLRPKGRLPNFRYAENYADTECTYSTKEAEAYRAEMREKMATAYAALGNDGWKTFYVEVMGGSVDGKPGGKRLFPAKYNGVTGSIFELIVKKSMGKDLMADRPLFSDPDLKKNPRIGDAASHKGGGNVIVDAKASDAGIDPEQCEDYGLIISKPVLGLFKSEDKPVHRYVAVAYTVPGNQELADKVSKQIDAVIQEEETRAKFHVSPTPKDLAEFLVQFNPTIRLQSKEKGKSSYTFNDPTTGIEGVKIKKASLQVDGPTARIKSGSLDMSVDMAGAIKNDKITKPITPGADPSRGSVENKLDGFKSTLDKVLGAVTIDAKLIDGGVEATIAMKQGAAKIPQFEVDAATLTARYINGVLSVDGEVGLHHVSKKVSGKIKVEWNGASWAFDGQATLAEGLVPGLSQVTLGVKYADGKTKITCPEASYERKLGAVTLKGTVRNLEYDVDTAGFSGTAEIDADLGMFGKAGAVATLEKNELKKAQFSYDSPEFKYPAKSEQPAFKGTVGGTITYDAGKFSGAIRGSATLNIPALKAVAGEGGVGLAVDADIAADGSTSGTVRTTTPLTFGKHVQIPSVACTIQRDGSMEGSFEIKIVKIKFLNEASIKCKVTKAGVEIEEAKVEVPFGNAEGGSFWGTLSAGYSKGKGLEIGGAVNYKIKEGMVATGTLKYSTETHEVSLSMTVSEITLMDKTVSKTLFKASKQIPIVNVYGLGIYIDIGFDLGFNFGFKLGFKPTVDFEGLSLETFEFKKIAAKLELLGKIFAELTGTPKLGLGVFALSPSILRGGGGLKVPIVGRAEVNPTGTLAVSYSPSGGVEGDAKLGMNMTFGITGSVKPYAEFSVLDGLWNPTWEGDALTQFEILKPKELFNFVVDLGGDMKKKEPELPGENAAKEPSKPAADKVLPETKSAPTERSGPASNPEAQGQTAPKEGGDEGPFSIAALKPLLEQLPGAAAVKKILTKAGEVWDKIKGFFGRVMNVFRDFFKTMMGQIEEILDGFASKGLGYLPTLVKKIVGDTVYEIIEPLLTQLGSTSDAILSLFETDPPKGLTDFMPWVWKVAKKSLGLAFDSLSGFISAIRQMMDNARSVASKLVNRAVTDGWIGVKRHYYLIGAWGVGHKFMAASEYKLNIPGIINLGHHPAPGFLLTPSGAVAIGLYELLEEMGVPVTYAGKNADTGEPYNDRWSGPGSRG